MALNKETLQSTISNFKNFQAEQNDTAELTPNDLAAFIDHTLLRPNATEEDIRTLCKEATQYGFKTVCVNSSWISFCAKLLSLSSTVPIAVIGFPLGAGLTASKAAEARMAIEAGAKEIDMVIAIGRLKGGDYDYVFEDIKIVYDACRHTPLKVILETSLLTHDEIVAACCICREVGVAFVKTSTGFVEGGASAENVSLMKAVVGEAIEVKASGGIRTYKDAIKMYSAGARRIGTSASVAIVSTIG